MAYVTGAVLFILFAGSALYICGWDMLKDILLSPIRRYDFDDEIDRANAGRDADGK